MKWHFVPCISISLMLAFAGVAASETVTGYIFGDGTEQMETQQGCDYYDFDNQKPFNCDHGVSPVKIVILATSPTPDNVQFPSNPATFKGVIIWPSAVYQEGEGPKCGQDIVGLIYPDGKVSIKAVVPINLIIHLPNFWGEGKIVNVGRKNSPKYQLTGELLFEHGAVALFNLTLQQNISINRCSTL